MEACNGKSEHSMNIWPPISWMSRFGRNGRNCYYNECQNLTFGRHPIHPISGMFVFSDRSFHNHWSGHHPEQDNQSILWPHWLQNILYSAKSLFLIVWQVRLSEMCSVIEHLLCLKSFLIWFVFVLLLHHHFCNYHQHCQDQNPQPPPTHKQNYIIFQQWVKDSAHLLFWCVKRFPIKFSCSVDKKRKEVPEKEGFREDIHRKKRF